MIFRTFKPGPPLSDFIDDFWLYDDYAPPQLKDRILPTGTIELVINLRDDELRIYNAAHPERCKRFPGALVSGAYGGSFVIDTLQEASLIGVHFKQGGAFPFLGLPASDLADAHCDLETLWGPPAMQVREQLCAAVTPEERFRVMEEALIARLSDSRKTHYAVPVALHSLGITGQKDASVRVRDVARHIGISERRFIEVFKMEVGMTPKLFYRVQRFQRVLALVGARVYVAPAALDWAQLAVDCGYFDQSHLIHDFLKFSGFSPAGYLHQLHSLCQQGVHIKRSHLPLIE